MARKSKAKESQRTGSSGAADLENPDLNENEEVESSDRLLAEGESVGPWSNDEDEEPNAFDAAGAEDDEEELDADGDRGGAPLGYQASTRPRRE